MAYKDSVKARERTIRYRARKHIEKYGVGAGNQKGLHTTHPKGSNSAWWSDEKIFSSHGYVKIRVGVDHPLADPNGYAYEHLVVWVSAGNERPSDKQVLHHKNEVKPDNRIENLELKDRPQHGVLHGGGIPDEDVFDIRTLYSQGYNDMATLAAMYGVSVARVSKFIRGDVRMSAGGPISTDNRGKKTAGRLLDGREHNDFPVVTHG